jgi:hypothetical protein
MHKSFGAIALRASTYIIITDSRALNGTVFWRKEQN